MDVEKILGAMLAIGLGIVGVAALTALVSNQSQSPQVIGSAWTGFACSLKSAMTGRNECTGAFGANSNVSFSCGQNQFFDPVSQSCKQVPGT